MREKKQEAKKPEEKKQEAKKPEKIKPEAKKPNEQKTKAKEPDEKKTDAKKPEEKKPEAKKPEEKKREEEKPEAKKAEEKKPEAKKVEEKPKEEPKPDTSAPNFTKVYEDNVVKPKASLTLEVMVTGKPEPEIKWFKDDEQIKANFKNKISKTGEMCTLLISGVTEKQSGVYKCV